MMRNKAVYFAHLEGIAKKLNNYLFEYYQNSQKIKEKILTCQTLDELEKLCLSLDNSREKIKIESLFTGSALSIIKPISKVSDEFLSSLKILVVNPNYFAENYMDSESEKATDKKLTHRYNRKTGKIEPIK